MNVHIQIHYLLVDIPNKALRIGTFPLSGRMKEQTAFEFWKWIKRETPVEIALEKVIVDGEDITELVMKLEKAPFK